MRCHFTMLAAAVLAGMLGGCDFSQRVEKHLAPDTQSLADRCGDIMQRAMPFAELAVGDKTSHSIDVRTIVAQVAATRTDMAKNDQVTRDLTAECTFTDNVLTGFRWTQGGPEPAPAPPSTHTGPEPAPAPPSTHHGP
ncbi:MAG TPA: hypothetical protein VG308_09635 [Stellaceae bacterium]|nr:hypothetical protein [Stellaceae bacterium]